MFIFEPLQKQNLVHPEVHILINEQITEKAKEKSYCYTRS